MRKKWLVYLVAAAVMASSIPMTALAAGFEAVIPEEEIAEQELSLSTEQGLPEQAEEVSDEKEERESVEAENMEVLTASGTSGTTDWTLDGSGTLRVSGVGSTADSTDLRNYKNDVRQVIIEEGVTGIGYRTFFDFQKLETVDLPDSLRTIGKEAFCQCYSLQELYIPKGVKSIESEAFYFSGREFYDNGSNLISVTFDKNIQDLEIASKAFGMSGISNLYIAGSNITMGNEVFAACGHLTNVEIAPGLVSTGYGVFRDCESLTSIVIPGTVKTMSSGIFSGCGNLRSVVLEEGVEKIGENFCFCCTSLTSVTLPKTLKEIPVCAFQGCVNLTSLVFPDGLEAIRERAFQSCTGLKSIVLPASVKTIGRQAFILCISLESAVLNNGLTSIANGAFHNCTALREIIIPGTVKELYNVFNGCTALREVTLMDGVQEVSYRAFAGCSGLSEIHFPGSLTYIGEGAFTDCSSLAELYFEGDAPEFQNYAFTDVIADAYYPMNAEGWTADVRKDYNGRITWHGYAPEMRIPELISAENTSSGIKVSWNPVSGASGYAVWRKSGSGSWSYVGRTTNTSYNNGTGKAGTSYTYTVRAYRGNFDTANKNKYDEAYWSKYDASGVTAVRLTPGKISSVTNTASSINVKWNAVTGAKGYYLYKKTESGSYVRIATLGSSVLSYSDKEFKNGTAYTYAVRPYNGSSRGTYTGVKTYRLSRSLISSAVKSGSGRITVKWGKNVRVSGYQIAYKTGGTTKYKTVSGSANVSTVLTGLSAGKSYTIQVRGYKTVSGKKYYAGWSTAKTVKA